eukprot:337141-Rhodomonas_salina.1
MRRGGVEAGGGGAQVGEHRWVKTDASSSVNRLPPSHRALILSAPPPPHLGRAVGRESALCLTCSASRVLPHVFCLT